MAATVEQQRKQRTARVEWAGLLKRTFALDVFACPRCGGRRKVLAYVTTPAGVRSILEHLGLPTQAPKRAPARGPPQQAWC
ncbi:ATP-dependent helicase HrpA [Cystobacter ferrugineus]|uniref:ATP-dependent helicase HrpA n=1 Tax=Cystobacter ferrugineus TaxID=83449 RepID=A0A1L9B1Y1_9BACT|nr:ATP-dependent helicase HrpA [Cystobacter ferrugineus]OJH36262.1 ATP-dependent helicase HrpA [Cystobacter ferrugineus]